MIPSVQDYEDQERSNLAPQIMIGAATRMREDIAQREQELVELRSSLDPKQQELDALRQQHEAYTSTPSTVDQAEESWETPSVEAAEPQV